MDAQNNIYLAAGTMTQMAVCKVNSNGTSGWTIAVPGAYANGIDIGNDNSVYVVGGNTAGATLKILQGVTSVSGNENTNPSKYYLGNNYPNPFNPSTKISFGMQKSGFAEITIYDITGKAVKTILNKFMNAGSHTIDFNASGLSSGTYMYKLTTADFTETKKMILTK
jgi:hypothetical protein